MPCTTAGASVTDWTFDAVGNRKTETRAGVTRTYTYDVADQLASITGGTAPVINYTYDENGNEKTATCPTACAATRTLVYNVPGQIRNATTPTGSTAYQYDGLGNRAVSTDTGASTTNIKYAWDTNGSLPMLAVETNGAGVTVRSYAYGLEPITMTTDTGTPSIKTYSYLTDMMGSVAVMGTTNNATPANALYATYRYEAYGTRTVGASTLPAGVNTPLQFTGEYNDSTNLQAYNLRARTYDPSNGRFTQTDPLPAAVGSPFESSYVYVGNSPLVYVDPAGTCRGKPGSTWTTYDPSGNPITNHRGANGFVAVGGVSITPGGPDDCDRFSGEIRRRVDELRKRYAELREDKLGLPLGPGPMTIIGHQEQFRGWQQGLRNFLDKWNMGGCGGPPNGLTRRTPASIPDDSWKWATRPAPSPAVKQVAGPNWLQRNLFGPINDATDAVWKKLTTVSPDGRPAFPIVIPFPGPVPA